jgi:hypothetical protein
VERYCAAREPGAAAARDHRHSLPVAPLDDRSGLLGRLGKGDRSRAWFQGRTDEGIAEIARLTAVEHPVIPESRRRSRWIASLAESGSINGR